MSLSVSSFPEAPAKLSHGQKRQKQPPSEGEGKRAFFGTLLSKGSVPFLKRIRHFAKVNVNVKGSVIHHQQHHPEKVPPSRSHSRHPSSVATSPIKAPGIVIDLIAVPQKGEYFPPSKRDDADATSFRESWPSPPTSPTALPFPSVTNHVFATPPPTPTPLTVPNDDPASRRPLRNLAQPSERDGEIAPVVVVDDLTSHDSQASAAPSAKPPAELSRRRSRAMTSPTSSTAPPRFVTVTTISPTSHSPTAQFRAAPTSTEGRVRSRSISTSVKRAATAETVPVPVPALPGRSRHKSETSIGVRHPITLTPNDMPQVKRRGRGKSSPTAPLPSGIPLPKHQLQQQQQQQQQPQPQERGESRPKRPRQLSNSSSRSGTGAGAGTGSSNIAPQNPERPPPPPPLQAPSKQQQGQNNQQSLLTAHMLCMRSGSRPLPSTTHTHHLLSVSGRPFTTAHAHAHAGARSNPSTTRAITATSLLVPRLSPEQMSADGAYVTRQRPRTTDGASASSRPRTPSTSRAVRSSEGPHDQVLPPPPTPQTPTLGLVDGGGRRSRLPVLNPQAMVSRAATAAAVETVGSN